MQIEISTSGIVYPTVGKKVIRDRLPGMNDIIDISKLGRGKYQPYSKMKIFFQAYLYSFFKNVSKFEKIKLKIEWYEPNAKRDIDNITAGTKFIMDALVNYEIIKDDSQKYVIGLQHSFYVDKKNPRIIVNIMEVK